MHANPRYDTILEYLQQHKRAAIPELCALVYVSEATMRRDLRDMQKLGLLNRTRGGAMYIERTEEVALSVRQSTNAQDKESTVSIALSHIPDCETIFVDNSSTCLMLVQQMDLHHKVVVTNSFRIADALSRKEQVQIIMPGGEFRNNMDLAGSMACNALRNFRFDLMLSSCAAIGLNGTFENSLPVKELKSAALEVADRRILLADQTKFLLKSPYRVASLRDYDEIITNASGETLRPYLEAGISIRNR